MEISSKSLFSTTPQNYFKMGSPTLQYIFMNKQAIFECREQIFLFLRGPRIFFSNFEKYIGARTMDQQESRVYTVNK